MIVDLDPSQRMSMQPLDPINRIKEVKIPDDVESKTKQTGVPQQPEFNPPLPVRGTLKGLTWD